MNSRELFVGRAYGEIMVINFNKQELDMIEAEEISTDLEDFIAKGKIYFVLNFNNVKFISTSVMVSLIRLRKSLSEVKGEMNICSLNEHILKVFGLTRLDRVFDICDSEEKALDALTRVIKSRKKL